MFSSQPIFSQFQMLLILDWQILNFWSLKFPACLWLRLSWIQLVFTAFRVARPKKAGWSILMGWCMSLWIQSTWLLASQHRDKKIQSKTLSNKPETIENGSKLQINQNESLWVMNILSQVILIRFWPNDSV